MAKQLEQNEFISNNPILTNPESNHSPVKLVKKTTLPVRRLSKPNDDTYEQTINRITDLKRNSISNNPNTVKFNQNVFVSNSSKNTDQHKEHLSFSNKQNSPIHKSILNSSSNHNHSHISSKPQNEHKQHSIDHSYHSNMFGLNKDSLNNSVLSSNNNHSERNNQFGTEMIVKEREITEKEESKIFDAFKNHFLFKELTPELMQLLFQELILYQFEKDNIIYQEGGSGNYCFILLNGSLESSCGGRITRIIKEYEIFGELSLISQCKREETVKCATDVLVYALEGDSFRNIQKRLNETRLKERFAFLNKLSFFKPLDIIAKYNISEKIKIVQFNPNDTIIKEGSDGDSLFVIKEGCVSCQKNGIEIRKLKTNDYFGQNCILYEQKRSLDVIAVKHCILFELKKNDLREALGTGYKEYILFSLFKEAIALDKYLSPVFSELILEDIFKCFTLKMYKDKEKLFPSSSTNRKIFVVIEGNICREVSRNQMETIMCRGGILGGILFKHPEETLRSDLIAHPDLISLEANIDSVEKCVQLQTGNYQGSQHIKCHNNAGNLNDANTLKMLKRINKLREVYLFKHLSSKLVESIAKSMIKHKYHSGEIIVQEDTFGDTFYLITKGSVKISKNQKVLRNLEKGSCFGEIALINSQEKRTASVTAITDVVCYVLSKSDFEKIIKDKNIKQYLIQNLSLQNTFISLHDLYFVKFLGKGKFGNVNLVHNKQNFYAIKAISLKKASAQPILTQYILSEKKIMLLLDHPFIVKLVKTLKNASFCFFLLEYVNGKNLGDYVKNRKKIKNIEETQFYIGSMLIMLDYLQKKLIAHRDIKPSNIMIDGKGYLKLIDFGTAKILHDYTNTVIGTPHYIAPEILQGKGYSISVDFWSVGICMYELFYGVYPFGNDAREVIEVYKEIMHKELLFQSENPKYKSVHALISLLLNKKVNVRCCKINELKSHDFFKGFDWNKLMDFSLLPPYMPRTTMLEKKLLDSRENLEKVIMQEEMGVNSNGYNYRMGDTDDFGFYDKKWVEEF